MLIIIREVRLKYDQHRTLIMTYHKPNWLEWLFGRRGKDINYVGKGTKWKTFPELKDVNPRLSHDLDRVERRWEFARRKGINMNFTANRKLL